MTPDKLSADMEAVAWMDRDVAWDVISDVHKKRWSEINGPESTQRYSRPLYASPVVPVGREEIARIIQDSVWADDATEFTDILHGIDDAADTILAALTGEDQ